MDNTYYSFSSFVNPTGQSIAQFCRAMISRGETVKKVVQESGYTISSLARKIKISRAQLYLDFANPEMSFDRILAIGKVLSYDFSQDFRDLPSDLTLMVNEGPSTGNARQLNECRDKLVATQSQLIEALQLLDRYKQKYGVDFT